MRILISHHNKLSYGGGGETLLVTLANYLHKRGHYVEINSLPLFQDKYAMNAPPRLESGVKYMEKWLHSSDADVCYAVYTPIVPIYLISSCPTVIGIHSHKLMFGAKKATAIPTLASVAHRLVGKRVIDHYEAVHVSNRIVYELVDHRLKYYISDPVDADFFRPTVPKSRKFMVMYAGRKDWDKGWDIFLEVRRKLSGYDVEFLVADGLSREQLVDAYSSAHVVVAPSRKDTFGLVIVEAMLCNTPVITTSIRTHRELQLPLIYGDSAEEIVREIKQLMKDPPRINYREAAMKYSIHSLGPRYEEMLREVSELQVIHRLPKSIQ
jgi:glycosyltransferase involved in cell wall biosynthesis